MWRTMQGEYQRMRDNLTLTGQRTRQVTRQSRLWLAKAAKRERQTRAKAGQLPTVMAWRT